MSGRLSYRTRRTAKLIEPGKRSLHDPAPTAQSTPVRGTTHGESRHDVAATTVRAESPSRRSRDPRTHSGRCRGRPRSECSGERHPRPSQIRCACSRAPTWSSRASQSSSAKWIGAHTPACCQSRKRRQHVIPDPHPSSRGSICQEMPLRRTKTMPVRHARSETRGRPPWSTGRNRQERFEKIPQHIWEQRGGHTPFTLPR